MTHNRQPIDLHEWNRGLPDFVDESVAFKREMLALAVLALGFVSGVLFMLI